MAPKYKLIYFPLTGLGESIRLLFIAAGVEYEDCRVPYEEWPNVKPDMPQNTLPVLVIDGTIRLTQSNAIARYVARELCLYGKNSLEAAQINEIVDTLKDLTEAVRPSMVELDKVKKVELRKKFQTEDAPKYLAFVEKQIASYGKDGFAVSTSFSLADAQIYALFSFFIPKNLLEGFPKVQETMNKVESHTNIAKYLTERPESLLPPQFRDEPTEDVWFEVK